MTRIAIWIVTIPEWMARLFIYGAEVGLKWLGHEVAL
jgi:hypothetical protein